jgi:hypothetical protein
VLVILAPVTCTKTVFVTDPDVTVTVMGRLARLPPMVKVPLTLPLASVVLALCAITPSLSADRLTAAPETTTRAALTAVAVMVTEPVEVFGS